MLRVTLIDQIEEAKVQTESPTTAPSTSLSGVGSRGSPPRASSAAASAERDRRPAPSGREIAAVVGGESRDGRERDRAGDDLTDRGRATPTIARLRPVQRRRSASPSRTGVSTAHLVFSREFYRYRLTRMLIAASRNEASS